MKKIGQQILSNPTRALEVAGESCTAATIKSTRMIAVTSPDVVVIKVVHRENNQYL